MSKLILGCDFDIIFDTLQTYAHSRMTMKPSYIIALVLLGIFGCNRPTADEYFTLAENARNTGNMNIALENYKQIVDHYPGNARAEEAQFNVASITQNTLHKYTDAIAEYRKFGLMFPHSPKAPAALFLQGYIFNNDLNEIDSAGAAYKQFLALYPDHEMAASARFELDNLGKSPEQLLQDHMSADTTPAGEGKPGHGNAP
jgi:tetratricopeptide (TPR) repeat protein